MNDKIHMTYHIWFYFNSKDDFPLASLPLLGYSVFKPNPETDGIHKDFVFKLQFKNHVYFFRAESQYTFERWENFESVRIMKLNKISNLSDLWSEKNLSSSFPSSIISYTQFCTTRVFIFGNISIHLMTIHDSSWLINILTEELQEICYFIIKCLLRFQTGSLNKNLRCFLIYIML